MWGINLRTVTIAGVVALLTFTHFYVYNAGKSAIKAKLLKDRVTILQDGKVIDNEVLQADDSTLCKLLGGCVLPDSDKPM